MKFIHFADAHLDSPFRGLSFLPSKAFNQIYQAADQSLSRIVDLALQEKVDLVLIAGDTFDSNQPSPRSQIFFAKEIKRLIDAEIQVVMIFGNHDHMNPDDLLVATSPYFKLLGPNEKVEEASFVTKNGFKYQVNGFSYLNNHITENKIPEFPRKNATYTFGIMHAQEKTSTNSQNVYAPFSINELKSLNYDYFALGHIHLRQNLSTHPWLVYSGNIQGRHINEQGEKGCYLGEINEETKDTQIKFYSTSPLIWQSREIKLTNKLSKSELQDQILQGLADIQQTTYFSVNLFGSQYLTDEELELVQDNDFWQSISRQLPFNSQLVDLRLKNDEQLTLNNSDQLAFDQAEQEIFNVAEFNKLIKDWSNKDILSESLAQDPEFLKNVESLTKIKLASQLKGIKDETETN